MQQQKPNFMQGLTNGLKNMTSKQKMLLGAVLIVGMLGTYMMRGQDFGKVAILIMYPVLFVVQGIRILNTAAWSANTYGYDSGAAPQTFRNGWEVYAPLWALAAVLLAVDVLTWTTAFALNPLSLGLFAWLPGPLTKSWANRAQAGDVLREANVTTRAGQAVQGSALTTQRDYSGAERPTTAAAQPAEFTQYTSATRPDLAPPIESAPREASSATSAPINDGPPPAAK